MSRSGSKSIHKRQGASNVQREGNSRIEATTGNEASALHGIRSSVLRRDYVLDCGVAS